MRSAGVDAATEGGRNTIVRRTFVQFRVMFGPSSDREDVMRALAGLLTVACLAFVPIGMSNASPSALTRTQFLPDTALVRCNELAALACKATCPTDTVENYEACAHACEVANGCA